MAANGPLKKSSEGSLAGADAPDSTVYDHHAQHGLLFLFFGLVVGCFTEWFLCRYAHGIPYTVAVLLWGVLISAANVYSGDIYWQCQHSSIMVEDDLKDVEALVPVVVGGLGTLSTSITMWAHMDPHLLLFAFLPALLFGDAMGLNKHLATKCFSPCLLLAGPGVLVGCAMTGAAAFYIFPYGWNWMFSLAFGSILAATDPVAVVALLKALGASPKLTMLITGESLMNDGAAIVMFNLFLSMYKVGAHHIA